MICLLLPSLILNRKKIQILQRASWPPSSLNYGAVLPTKSGPVNTANLGMAEDTFKSKRRVVLCRQEPYKLVLAYSVFQLGEESFVFTECSLAAELELTSLQTFMTLEQRPPPPKQNDDFCSQLKGSTSPSKNVKRIYTSDANGQRRKTG